MAKIIGRSLRYSVRYRDRSEYSGIAFHNVEPGTNFNSYAEVPATRFPQMVLELIVTLGG